VKIFLGLQRRFELLGELINEPKPSVVAGVLVFSAWVAQANKQFDHAGIIYPSSRDPIRHGERSEAISRLEGYTHLHRDCFGLWPRNDELGNDEKKPA
jgi:hypothetical protein